MALSEPRPVLPLMTLRVDDAKSIAVDTRLFELSGVRGEILPAIAPGAHVDVHLSEYLVRQYSVVTPLCTPTSYVIAVKRQWGGRGGSQRLHDDVAVGSLLRVGLPRNHYPLNEFAGETVLLAGGIGITPIYGMFERLQEIKRGVHLHYWCRSEQHTLFRDRLEGRPNVVIHYPGPGRATLADVLDGVDSQSELYCCGPERMLAEFAAATRSRPIQKLHVERFSPADAPALDAEFTVILARSGVEVTVRRGQTILDALRGASVDVAYSCEEGVCGACEVKFLCGNPVHRDAVRTAAEHNSLSTVMICCAGSRSGELTLDL